MKGILIIFISTILFWGCGDNSDRTLIKTSDKKTTIVNFTSTNSDSDNFILNDSQDIEIKYINTIGLHGNALDIALSNDGNFAYIASGDRGLEIINITNPYSPKLIGTYDTYGYVNHVEVIGNIAYVSYIAQTWDDYEQVNAYDISNPNDAQYIGFYEGYTSNNHKIVKTDSKIYYLTDDALHIINKANNNQGSYTLYDPHAVAVKNGYAFIANGREGVTIITAESGASGELIAP